MSILHDKYNRWYCIFIVVLGLLLVVTGITATDTQTKATKEMGDADGCHVLRPQ